MGRELITQQNKRFIRNRLSKGTIEKPAARVLTPLGSDGLTPIVITDVDGQNGFGMGEDVDGRDGFGMGKAELPTPMNLNTSGDIKPSSAVGVAIVFAVLPYN